MGILLLPSKKKKISPNPAVDSLQIVYTPSDDGDAAAAGDMALVDPSNVKVSFQSAKDFEAVERITR